MPSASAVPDVREIALSQALLARTQLRELVLRKTWFPLPFRSEADVTTFYSQRFPRGFQILVLIQLALAQFALPQPAWTQPVLLQSALAPLGAVKTAAMNADAHRNSQPVLIRFSVLQPLVLVFLVPPA